jgi:tight adherence protein C
LTILALLLGVRGRAQARALEQERMYAVGSTTLTLEDIELSRPLRERVIAPAVSSILGFFGRLAPQRNIEALWEKLELAGRPFGWTAADFLGLRLLAAVLLSAVAFAILLFGGGSLRSRILLMAFSGVLGFYLPVLWLGSRIRRRQHDVLRALPDGLDMLNICVGAGLGFDAALGRVGERWAGPLADEFNRVLAEMRLGKSRREALLDMSARTQVVDVENFVATIVQADQLGVSIAKVLRSQAEQMRILRRQRAEEAARQASIKLLFPLVFMIFPALLAVLLGPALPQLINTLSNLGG